MIRKKGDLVEHLDDYTHVCITANAFVKNNGELVMGRGFAKTATQLWPQVAREAGSRIRGGNMGVKFPYHLLLVEHDGIGIWLFQVKHHWREEASLELIAESAKRLGDYAARHSEQLFALPYPGIGNGRLAMHKVAPLIQDLPDNVHVWTFE